MANDPKISRRRFLKWAAGAGVAGTAVGVARHYYTENEKARILQQIKSDGVVPARYFEDQQDADEPRRWYDFSRGIDGTSRVSGGVLASATRFVYQPGDVAQSLQDLLKGKLPDNVRDALGGDRALSSISILRLDEPTIHITAIRNPAADIRPPVPAAKGVEPVPPLYHTQLRSGHRLIQGARGNLQAEGVMIYTPDVSQPITLVLEGQNVAELSNRPEIIPLNRHLVLDARAVDLQERSRPPLAQLVGNEPAARLMNPFIREALRAYLYQRREMYDDPESDPPRLDIRLSRQQLRSMGMLQWLGWLETNVASFVVFNHRVMVPPPRMEIHVQVEGMPDLILNTHTIMFDTMAEAMCWTQGHGEELNWRPQQNGEFPEIEAIRRANNSAIAVLEQRQRALQR